MRVLFVTPAWNTHFFNLVPLAWALRTAGHTVRVAAEPELTDVVTAAGLAAVPVGSDEPITLRARRAEEAGLLPPADLRQDAGGRPDWAEYVRLYDSVVVPRARIANDAMVADLVAHCRAWEPDLVVWDGLAYAGAIAADAAGAAHARVTFTIDLNAQLRDGFLWARAQRPPGERRDPLAEWLGEHAARHGGRFSERLVSGHFTIDRFPDSFRLPSALHYVPMRYVPYNGRAVVPDWALAPPRAPRVLMTLGLSLRNRLEFEVMPADRVRETFDALADLDIELVATLPAEVRDRLGPLPGNTRVVGFAPLHEVLPGCAAMIHHGGAGTFYNALLYGTPQLLVSNVPDAAHKEAHLRERRAGLSVPPGEVTGPRIRDALVRLLEDPAFRAGAGRLRQEVLAQPPPNAVVPELEKATARYRRREGARGRG
ncbi:activator-dependent family glycosyltransferase [Actinomadura roseirufa]|uniref:activator-dependent family glycosyltransferase n=1 Tax=Actinomadura roseirufa TaxID=2094049 RepID=UPI001040E83F|nr:activator-dependent family glycosyltransferase [Actinomadura roseirufa]